MITGLRLGDNGAAVEGQRREEGAQRPNRCLQRSIGRKGSGEDGGKKIKDCGKTGKWR